MQPPSEHISDVLIVGSGAAGLSLALRLAQHCKVTVLSKEPHFMPKAGSPQFMMKRTALIVRCAIARKENRGLHYTLDYPERLSEALPTILHP